MGATLGVLYNEERGQSIGNQEADVRIFKRLSDLWVESTVELVDITFSFAELDYLG